MLCRLFENSSHFFSFFSILYFQWGKFNNNNNNAINSFHIAGRQTHGNVIAIVSAKQNFINVNMT